MTTLFASLRAAATADDPGLVDVPLPPDGRYQRQEVTIRGLSDAVSGVLRAGFEDVTDFPLLVVGWGRCRVGSTAMTNLFGIAGAAAYYQPVKTIARFRLVGGAGSPWRFGPGERILFAKEMAGPYLPYEALFNPIECLMAAGWPADRLHLLVLDREPRDSLDSWMGKWHEKIGRTRVIENFLLSTANYDRMRAFARRAGVTTTHFPYEASRAPVETVRWLFDRIGIGDLFDERLLSGWGASGDLNSADARIHYPDEPQEYVVPGIHGQGDAYSYQPRRITQLRDDELRHAEDEMVVASYRTSVDAFCRDLDVSPQWRQKIFPEAL
ncbi:hypothetical protein [Micromonospora sp. NPDC049891]|uniref:hypothetical protein n=1 Tax=Micromonospora sp. NPDC049891 TaxID=3155655 RepID=UPI0033E2BB2B